VTNQVRRFIDEVISSLVYDVSTLRIEKEALQEQYELTRYALHEAGMITYTQIVTTKRVFFRKCETRRRRYS
jgi:hypothetical protein